MIFTFSKFYYGFTVDETNFAIDFNEGASELQASLDIGSYSLEEFVDEVETQLNLTGALTYTVSVNRTTRLITISAGSNFTLLSNAGTRSGTAAWGLLGISTASDKTGASTYDSDTAVGSVFTPQRKFQFYLPSTDNKSFVDPVVSESQSGVVELVSYGIRRFVEFNLDYISSTTDTFGSVIQSNTGHEDAIAFMEFITTKSPIEFMPDVDTPATFETLILETTPTDRKGVSYKLKELYARGLPDIYETGKLRFRVKS